MSSADVHCRDPMIVMSMQDLVYRPELHPFHITRTWVLGQELLKVLP